VVLQEYGVTDSEKTRFPLTRHSLARGYHLQIRVSDNFRVGLFAYDALAVPVDVE
jgi:hypothetical protein